MLGGFALQSRRWGVSVYDDPVTADSSLFYAPDELESLLREELVGREDLAGVPIRTRSFLAKRLVCSALGYEPPKSFRRANPRLPHPTIDVYRLLLQAVQP